MKRSAHLKAVLLLAAAFLLSRVPSWIHLAVHRVQDPHAHPLGAMLRAAVAAPLHPECSEVRKRFKRGGVAKDARERNFGRVRINETVDGTFSEQEDQVTWWGEFDRSFSYWGEPRLESKFYDPAGEVVYEKRYTADRCKLARISMPLSPDQVRRRPGTWKVETSCDEGPPLDSQTFEVRPASEARDREGGIHIGVDDL